MPTLTITRKPRGRKMTVEIDLDQWEKLQDALKLYQPSFLKSLDQSLKESRQGKVRLLKSLRELRK